MKKSILYSGIVLAMFSTMSMAVDSSSVPSPQEGLSAHQKEMADRLIGARQSAPTDSAPCKNEQGQPIECPKPELGHFDVCPNLDGDQNRLPPGRIMKDGDCILVNLENDVCSNIAGVQAYTPLGMVNSAGICEAPIAPPPIDVCPNIPGDQALVPDGMEIKNGDCVSSVPLPVDLCTNLDGGQAVIPKGYTQNADGTCTMIESCVPWNNMRNLVLKNGPGLYKSAKGDIYLIALMDSYKFMPYETRSWVPEDARNTQKKWMEDRVEAPWGLQWYAVLGNFTSKDVTGARKDCDVAEMTKAACAKNHNYNNVIIDFYIKDRKTYFDMISSNGVTHYWPEAKYWFGHTVNWAVDKYTEKNYSHYYNGNPNYNYTRGANEDYYMGPPNYPAGYTPSANEIELRASHPYENIGANAAVMKGWAGYHSISYTDEMLTDDFWDFDNNFFVSDGTILTHDWSHAIASDCDVTISGSKSKPTEVSDIIEKAMYVKSFTGHSTTPMSSPTGTYNLDVFARAKANLKTLN